MLRSGRPIPTSKGIYRGSPAISPHTATGFPAAWATSEMSLIVIPIHGKGILDQVVRADAQKIEFLNQLIGQDRGRGHLDHRPQWNPLTKGVEMGGDRQDAADMLGVCRVTFWKLLKKHGIAMKKNFEPGP